MTHNPSTPLVRVAELLRQPWFREVHADEGGGYLACIPEVPGCLASGESIVQALANLDVVLRHWLTMSLERGDPIPMPGGDAK